MRSVIVLLCLLWATNLEAACDSCDPWVRGDCDGDGEVEWEDDTCCSQQGEYSDECDFDDDGDNDGTDRYLLLYWVFNGGTPPEPSAAHCTGWAGWFEERDGDADKACDYPAGNDLVWNHAHENAGVCLGRTIWDRSIKEGTFGKQNINECQVSGVSRCQSANFVLLLEYDVIFGTHRVTPGILKGMNERDSGGLDLQIDLEVAYRARASSKCPACDLPSSEDLVLGAELTVNKIKLEFEDSSQRSFYTTHTINPPVTDFGEAAIDCDSDDPYYQFQALGPFDPITIHGEDIGADLCEEALINDDTELQITKVHVIGNSNDALEVYSTETGYYKHFNKFSMSMDVHGSQARWVATDCDE